MKDIKEKRKEDINLKKMPKGQRLLCAGYKYITEDDISSLLEIDVLNELYLKEQIYKHAKENNFEVINYKLERSVDVFVKCKGVFSDFYFYRDEIEWDEKVLSLYADDKIPIDLLNETERCKQLGIKDNEFHVCYPIKRSKKMKDPILVVKLFDKETENESYFLIGKWL